MKKLIVSAMFILLLTTQVSAQIVVIANNSVPESSIDKDKLVKMFSMDATVWSNGNAVVLVELGVDGDTKNKFYGFLGTSAKKMKNAWMKKMLAGEGQAPDALDSEDAVLQKVASTPGAIGYVSKAKAGANVKILLEIN